MYLDKNIILFILMFYFNALQAQNTASIKISDELSLKDNMAKLVHKDFYIDTTKSIKIFFTLKIDSLGEVHSAHIRKSQNLNNNEHFYICYEIEQNFNLLFLYNKYKNTYEIKNKKYILISYPYFNEEKENP